MLLIMTYCHIDNDAVENIRWLLKRVEAVQTFTLECSSYLGLLYTSD